MRETLTNIELTSGQPWALNRAGFMLSVLDQLDAGTITQETATNWMYDVIRRIDEESTDQVLRDQIVTIAKQIGQIP